MTVPTVPLRYLAHVNRHTLPESTDPFLTFRYIDVSSVDNRGHVSVPSDATQFDKAPSRARRLAPAGAVVIATVRTYLRAIAQVPRTEELLVFSTGFAVLEANRLIESRFLAHACQSEPFIGEVIARSVGVSYPAINSSDLAAIPVPLPSLEVQRRIADFLDDQIGRIDHAIQLRQRQTALAREREISLFEDALATDTTSVQLRRFGTTVTTGPFGTVFAASDYVPDGIPMVNPTHIAGGRIQPDTHHSVSEETARRLSRHHLRTGDIVTGRKGDLGRSALVTAQQDGWICGSDAIAIHPDPTRLLPEFLATMLHSQRIRANLVAKSPGATMPSLNEDMLLSLELPAWHLAQQLSVAEKCSAVRAATEVLVRELTRSCALLTERKRSLITAAVSGEFDVSSASSRAADAALEGVG